MYNEINQINHKQHMVTIYIVCGWSPAPGTRLAPGKAPGAQLISHIWAMRRVASAHEPTRHRYALMHGAHTALRRADPMRIGRAAASSTSTL